MTSLQAIAHSKRIDKQVHPSRKIFLAGVGAVGGTFLKQITTIPSCKILGVCNSKNVLWLDSPGSTYSDLNLRRSNQKEWKVIIRKLASYKKGSIVFVDTTGDAEVSDLYSEILSLGIHVVTPSKLANTQSQQKFDELHTIARQSDVKFLYETNVGAGLPVIGTLKSLIESGDKILEISGVVSGTMTYIFSQLDKGESFSTSVIQARTLGYAEPDPRDDLSGEDVARKFLILARICGHKLERGDLEVESLIPSFLREVDSATFLERLHEADKAWKKRIEAVHARENVLRYTGLLKGGTVRVGLQEVPKGSPVGALRGTNNLIQIKSRRYLDQPLIIHGPGAGKEVTAAGVLSDVLKTG